MVRFSEEDKGTIWEMREAGVPVKQIAKHLGRQHSLPVEVRVIIGGDRPHAGTDHGRSLGVCGADPFVVATSVPSVRSAREAPSKGPSSAGTR